MPAVLYRAGNHVILADVGYAFLCFEHNIISAVISPPTCVREAQSLCIPHAPASMMYCLHDVAVHRASVLPEESDSGGAPQ